MKQCMDCETLHKRMKKIIGQVQAIDRMLDEDIPCEDVLAQINAAKSALHKVGQIVRNGDPDETIERFAKAMERFSNIV